MNEMGKREKHEQSEGVARQSWRMGRRAGDDRGPFVFGVEKSDPKQRWRPGLKNSLHLHGTSTSTASPAALGFCIDQPLPSKGSGTALYLKVGGSRSYAPCMRSSQKATKILPPNTTGRDSEQDDLR